MVTVNKYLYKKDFGRGICPCSDKQEYKVLFREVSETELKTDELDLDADTIWEDGELVRHETVKDIKEIIASQLIDARNRVNMTQKELAEKTGIYQADISKIERGIGNPSVMTLKRLADGLEIELIIKFKDNE